MSLLHITLQLEHTYQYIRDKLFPMTMKSHNCNFFISCIPTLQKQIELSDRLHMGVLSHFNVLCLSPLYYCLSSSLITPKRTTIRLQRDKEFWTSVCGRHTVDFIYRPHFIGKIPQFIVQDSSSETDLEQTLAQDREQKA